MGLWACGPKASVVPEETAQPHPDAVATADEPAPNAKALDVPDAVSAWWPQISAAADRHGLPPDLVALIVWLESGGAPAVVSPTGARGLMQLMPATAARVAEDRGEPAPTDDELSDPERNLELGCAHIAALVAELGLGPDGLDGDAVHRLAVAYNGGVGVLRAWDGGEPLPEETRAYAEAMRERWETREPR